MSTHALSEFAREKIRDACRELDRVMREDEARRVAVAQERQRTTKARLRAKRRNVKA